MKNAMTYKGYTARVEFDPRDGVFWGKVLGIADGITLEGESVATLTKDFHCAIDHYVADCERDGRAPQKPAPARSKLRVAPKVHPAASVRRASRRRELEPVG